MGIEMNVKGGNLTRKDIAKEAGVSPSTVSRALSGSPLIPEKTVERIRKISFRLGYSPNILARRLAANRSYQIGFALEFQEQRMRKGPIQMSYYSSILDAMIMEAFPKNYSVSIQPYKTEGDGSVRHFKELISSRHADGLVFAGLTQNSRMPFSLMENKIPFVLIGTMPSDRKILSVNVRFEDAFSEMFSTLESKKYRRIFFVGGDLAYYHAISQKKAFLEELGNSRIGLAGELKGDYSRTSGYAAAVEILKMRRKGDCVFLANDRMAAGFYRCCYERNVKIPGEIGVMGSDDDSACHNLFPELCTIRQPRYEMGRIALKMLIGTINGELAKSVLLDQSFISRASI